MDLYTVWCLFNEEEQDRLYQVMDGYTRLNGIHKPEALYVDTYHPVHYGGKRSGYGIEWSVSCSLQMNWNKKLLEQVGEKTGDTLIHIKDKNVTYASFYELIYYPAVASMNRYRCSYPVAGIFSIQAKGSYRSQ